MTATTKPVGVPEDLRDSFAMCALQGCLAYSWHNPARGNWQENCELRDLAAHCYQVADAMLWARAAIQGENVGGERA